eukprot:364809-Chlamydomonas_euryale.AAC.24
MPSIHVRLLTSSPCMCARCSLSQACTPPRPLDGMPRCDGGRDRPVRLRRAGRGGGGAERSPAAAEPCTARHHRRRGVAAHAQASIVRSLEREEVQRVCRQALSRAEKV